MEFDCGIDKCVRKCRFFFSHFTIKLTFPFFLWFKVSQSDSHSSCSGSPLDSPAGTTATDSQNVKKVSYLFNFVDDNSFWVYSPKQVLTPKR